MIYNLSDVTSRVEHLTGGNHSVDSCFLYVEEDRTLFLGDVLGPSVSGGPRRYTPDRFLRLRERIYSFDAQLVVESHGVPMEREAVTMDLRPWKELARIVGQSDGDRECVSTELRRRLGCDRLTPDVEKAVDYFLAGRLE